MTAFEMNEAELRALLSRHGEIVIPAGDQAKTVFSIAGYVRYSPRPGESEGETLTCQLDSIRRAIRAYSLDDRELRVFGDPDVSARKTALFERDGGSRLRKWITQEKMKNRSGAGPCFVFVQRLDRMFRSVVDGIRSLDELSAQAVNLVFAEQDGLMISTRTATGRFVATLLLGASEFEAGITAERVRSSHRSRRRNGADISGPLKIRYGYRPVLVDGVFRCEPDPRAVEIINAILDVYHDYSRDESGKHWRLAGAGDASKTARIIENAYPGSYHGYDQNLNVRYPGRKTWTAWRIKNVIRQHEEDPIPGVRTHG